MDFLKQFTKATAVYIGKLVSPKKSIGEADDDTAHLDPDAALIVHFLNATEGHEYLVDKVLRADQGLTFDVFKDAAVRDTPEEGGEEDAEAAQ